MLQKLDSYTKLIANLADKPNLSASDMKAYFDSSPEEIRVAFNNLIDALKAITDGDSGADNIGATAITGLDGTTVQALLEALKTQVDGKATNGGDWTGTWQGLEPTQADQALTAKVDAHLAEEAREHASMNSNIIDLAVELETMKGAILNGVDANIFIETFQTLDDINLEHGGYDSTNKRLVV